MGKKDYKMYENLVFISYLGFMMVTPIFLGVLGGNWLDQKLNLSPLFLLIGILLGVGASFRNLMAFAAKKSKQADERGKKH